MILGRISPWNRSSVWYQTERKTCYKTKILCRKLISILIDFKLLPLACKCVFHRPEHNAKGGTPWN